MRAKSLRWGTVACCLTIELLLSGVPAAAQQAKNEPSAEDLARANNPLANMTAINFQNYYAPSLTGLPDDSTNTMWLRFIKPLGPWLLRASLPLSTVPSTTSADPESGVGNLNAFMAYLLTSTAKKSFGVGPLIVAPTATNDALGTDKWQGGAAVVLFNVPSPQLQWGGLVTWQASFAGDDDEPDTNVGVVQPFAMFQLGRGTYLRSSAIWVFNFENDTYTVPIGLGIGKVLKVGGTVFNIFIEPQYTFLHQGVGQPELQIFSGLNVQFVGGGKKKKGK